MDIYVIYRLFKNPESGRVDKIETVEYCNNEADARKYTKLFDLQIPTDLRDRISHKNYGTPFIDA